jgi:mono/diheme cytochrome c family protein
MSQSISMRSLVSIVLLSALTTPLFALQTQAPAPAATPAKQNTKVSSHKSGYGSDGERIFAQQCSRCHTAPDGFSPHISGTIVLHMRVRASLSQHDEQELLHFLNP